MQNWKTWLFRLLPVVAVLFAGIAVREHVVAQQPGAYGAPDIGGIPITELGAGLSSLLALLTPLIKDWRSGGRSATAEQVSEQTHLSGLASAYVAEPDPEALKFVSDLAVHRKNRPDKPTQESPSDAK